MNGVKIRMFTKGSFLSNELIYKSTIFFECADRVVSTYPN